MDNSVISYYQIYFDNFCCPTNKYKTDLIALLTKLKKEEKITQKQYWHRYPMSDMAPRLYGSPKIHKEGNPLRPIVDYTGYFGI